MNRPRLLPQPCRPSPAAPQEFGVVGYTLLLSMIEYKTLVMRGDMDAAAEILPQIPQVRGPHSGSCVVVQS